MAAAALWTTPVIVPYRAALLIALALGLHGYRSSSLSRSGAITAALLGYLTLASPLYVFGVALLTFYLSGSRVTRVKARIKATLESTPTGSTGAQRTSTQVICNALFGSLCALSWRLFFSGELADGRDWTGRLWVGAYGSRWCVVDERWGASRALVLGAISFFAACAGDTFASELGILSKSRPILLTTLRTVPPGTNGGISALGVIVSILGGALVGATSALCLLIENPECKTLIVGPLGLPWWALVVGVGAWSGLVGSMIDSLLGATLQESLYSVTRKKIVHSRVKEGDEDVIESIAGWNVLSNNGVNLVASAGTAAVVVYWAGGVV